MPASTIFGWVFFPAKFPAELIYTAKLSPQPQLLLAFGLLK